MISFSSGLNGFKILVAISAGLSLYLISGSLTSDIGPLASDYVSITINRQHFFSNQPLYVTGDHVFGFSKKDIP